MKGKKDEMTQETDSLGFEKIGNFLKQKKQDLIRTTEPVRKYIKDFFEGKAKQQDDKNQGDFIEGGVLT